MGYSTTIIEAGPDASDFLAKQTAITFAGNAPEELCLYCLAIDKSEPTSPLVVDQLVLIGDQEWQITAIGDIAEKNLGTSGHVTLVFGGVSEPRPPGASRLSESHLEPAPVAGTRLVIGNA